MAESGEKQIVFIGLGNPGARYEMTRHNMGAILLQGFAKFHEISLREEARFLARTGKKSIQGAMVHLVLPLTYMNESGQAVKRYLDYFKLAPVDLIVISDDADLPFGELRLKAQGSSGGHNGLKSIEKHLGTSQYPRLKVGIGRGQMSGQELSDYVLDRFSREEQEVLLRTVETGSQALSLLTRASVEAAMNIVNRNAKEENKSNQEKNPKNTPQGDKQEEKL